MREHVRYKVLLSTVRCVGMAGRREARESVFALKAFLRILTRKAIKR